MTVLEMLRAKNPAIPIYDVNDSAFILPNVLHFAPCRVTPDL